MVNGVVSLISLSDLPLLVYRNTTNFCILILYPATLPNSLISCSTIIVLLFQFWFLVFIFLPWFLWLRLPKLCWIKVVRVLFSNDMIFYIENPNDSTRKLLELINDYSKVAGYKINTHKSSAFLYSIYGEREREIKETIPFTIAMKRIKYLGIYLPKETKDLYIRSDQISHSVVSDSLRPHESQHTRPPCQSPTPRVHSDSHPSSQWCHPAISSSVIPVSSCLQSFPASGSFQYDGKWGCFLNFSFWSSIISV